MGGANIEKLTAATVLRFLKGKPLPKLAFLKGRQSTLFALLKQFDGRPQNAAKQKDDAVHLISQARAASEAGFSERQAKNAVRIAEAV